MNEKPGKIKVAEVEKVKLSISNIGWLKECDEAVYDKMKKLGYSGLEIAPTRLFPERPYDRLEQAGQWSGQLADRYGFVVSSMQSIWFGRQEKLFGSLEEKKALLAYTMRAVDFAQTVGCQNLVFGCPKNRVLLPGADALDAVAFFRELGEYAAEHDTVIGMEANPPVYHTNYINDTRAALELIDRVDRAGFRLNLDAGTMIENKESADELKGSVFLINHVHISEPGLKPIEKRDLHLELRDILRTEGYRGFISIEMGKTEETDVLERAMLYVKEIFGQCR